MLLPAFSLLNPLASAPVLLICDHASSAVPSHLNELGLSAADLSRHIGWDIGAAQVTQEMSERMQATAVLGGASRLVIDLNRAPGDEGSIPAASDGTVIPGNRQLSQDDIGWRVDHLFKPYHAAIAEQIARLRQPVLLSIHSFTPVLKDRPRPWHVGILWNQDGRLALPLIDALRAEGDLCVGDNQPYSGRDLAYSMNVHAGARGLLHAGIEIRQDLIDTPEGAHAWAARLARILSKLVAS